MLHVLGNCDGQAEVIASGGTTPYTYQWDDALLQTTDVAVNLCAINYNVITTDANGCPSNSYCNNWRANSS